MTVFLIGYAMTGLAVAYVVLVTGAEDGHPWGSIVWDAALSAVLWPMVVLGWWSR